MKKTENNKIQHRRDALIKAINKNCSARWILQLWSRYIKERDLYRCLCCNSTQGIQAHHIVRKTLYPWGAFELGNGITLCLLCHKRVHAEFNGPADLSKPLGEGDDQDEWAFLFGLLKDDSKDRNLNQDEFYFISDDMLLFFVRVQGYQYMHDMVMRGEMSRIRFAHEIWRNMPEKWYTNFVSEMVRLNFT